MTSARAARCACTASLGRDDALRELGPFLQDGYSVRRLMLDGRRLLIQDDARELNAAVSASPSLLRDAGTGNKVSRFHIPISVHNCLSLYRVQLQLRWLSLSDEMYIDSTSSRSDVSSPLGSCSSSTS